MANLENFLIALKNDVRNYIYQSGYVSISDSYKVPNVNDPGFTFSSGQGKKGKLINTCVLFLDMRNSTVISNKHSQDMLARLYTSFIESMVKAGEYYGGKVRQIVGDRIMVVFDSKDCFKQALDTAILLNTVSKYIINKQFSGSEIKCGIGIDYGQMLVIKTGIAKQGKEKEDYRSLVWLGKPANIASKLTDTANKTINQIRFKVEYEAFPPIDLYKSLGVPKPQNDTTSNSKNHRTQEEIDSEIFTKRFSWDDGPKYKRKRIYSVEKVEEQITLSPILMTEVVFDNLKKKYPNRDCIKKQWISATKAKVKGYNGVIYGGEIIYTASEKL